jgi:hypothetical protein
MRPRARLGEVTLARFAAGAHRDCARDALASCGKDLRSCDDEDDKISFDRLRPEECVALPHPPGTAVSEKKMKCVNASSLEGAWQHRFAVNPFNRHKYTEGACNEAPEDFVDSLEERLAALLQTVGRPAGQEAAQRAAPLTDESLEERLHRLLGELHEITRRSPRAPPLRLRSRRRSPVRLRSRRRSPARLRSRRRSSARRASSRRRRSHS